MKLIFLGTAGGRFVVFKQIRASGGIWIESANKTLLIDPGPGSLVRIVKSKRKLNPEKIDYIILTHRHLDHSADVNTIIEAMTMGGFHRRGTLFVPSDAISKDPVVLKYLRGFLKEIILLEGNTKYDIAGGVCFETSKKLDHPVETYGLNFYENDRNILSFISDTYYFSDLPKIFNGENVVMNVVFLEKRNIKHLSIPDVRMFLSVYKPKKTILTHFGMSIVKAKPWELAKKLSEETGTEIIAAYDGMELIIE